MSRLTAERLHGTSAAPTGPTPGFEGFVEDTKADGKCAYVKAFANTGDARVPLAKACPKGSRTNFDWKVNGATDITAYLYTAA